MKAREKAGLFLSDHCFRVFSDDTFLVSYPRSGNTWMRNLIANLRHPEEDLGFQDLMTAVPDIHYRRAFFSRHERPRVIKSHCAYRKKYPKVIYIYRDGRDVAVSYYNFYREFKGYSGPFEDFVRSMLSGRVEFGSWHGHVKDWMWREHEIPFLPVRYETLYSDTENVLRTVAGFLGMDVDDGVIANAVRKSSIRRQNESFLKVFPERRPPGHDGSAERGPGSGRWREYFSETLLDVFWSEAGDVMLGLGYKKA